MNILFKSMAIAMNLVSGLQAMEMKETITLPSDNMLEILQHASKTQILELGSEASLDASIGTLRRVCKEWKRIIDTQIGCNGEDNNWKQKKKNFWIESLVSVYGVDCRIFLNGGLKYTPDIGDPILLWIADLRQPFSGKFNLSMCGDASKDLSIHTGYRKKMITEDGMITEDPYVVEIWFTPWFLVLNAPSNMVEHLNFIMPFWDCSIAPIGIFFNWEEWHNLADFEYMITADLKFISSQNLDDLYVNENHMGVAPNLPFSLHTPVSKNFMFILNKN